MKPSLESDTAVPPGIRITLTLLVLASLMPAPATVSADFSPFDWRQWAEVRPSGAQPGEKAFVRLSLSSQVLAAARPGLEDIRVLDAGGSEVPYAIRIERSESREVALPAAILNRGVIPGRYQQIDCDLGESGSPNNELVLLTDERNFSRRVDVLASQDGETWLQLQAGSHIFDQHQAYRHRNLRVAYPDTSYRWIKLRIWLDGEAPLAVDGVRVLRMIRKVVAPEPVPVRITRVEQDGERKTTDIFLETALENQHVDACVVRIEDDNFRREAELADRDERGVWRRLGGTDIFRFSLDGDVEERITIPVSGPTGRESRLRLWNRDNPPLDVASVEFQRQPRILVFEHQPAESYRLFVGNPSAAKPAYDLESMVDRLEAASLAAFETGALESNPEYREPESVVPWTERHPIAVWAALAFGILMLFWLLLRSLREMGRRGSGPGAES